MAVGTIKDNLTPAMRQWKRFKDEHPDKIVLFRMGDFYEIFGEDALQAAPALEIVLTTRDRDSQNPLPMCGVPFHAVELYLQRLLKAGFKAVIVEQVEDPKKARGIVRRDVTRILTPGTLLEEGLVDREERVLIACLAETGADTSVCYADLAKGELKTVSGTRAQVLDVLSALAPKELLVGNGAPIELPGFFVTRLEDGCFELKRAVEKIGAYYSLPYSLPGIPPGESARMALGAMLAYLERQKAPPLDFPAVEDLSGRLVIDESTRRNLELTANLEDGTREGTLLRAVDRTLTPMGKRLLEEMILSPPAVRAEIESAQAEVRSWLSDTVTLKRFRKILSNFPDWGRINARFGAGIATPRDAGALREVLSRLKEAVAVSSGVDGKPGERASNIPLSEKLASFLETALEENLPAHTREGGVFRKGFDPGLDELRELYRDAHGAILKLEAVEKERSGIPSLKIKYNKVFGYFIEITRAHLEKAPASYERKQTLVNAERFVTGEIRELETKILTAREESYALEQAMWSELCAAVLEELKDLREGSRLLAELDLYSSFAAMTHERGYVLPEMTEEPELALEEGRHPVLEGDPRHQPFVPNSTRLDGKDRQLIILTGPNMGGKSTYLRQVALLTIMAHLGMGIPARKATIGVVDRLFCRVGASDNLRRGLSTFMVEMTEASAILRNATPRSLVLLDEIGRGTSTFDGLAIAWAIAEALSMENGIGPRTLFATHYHELTDLARQLRGAHNLTMGVREHGGKVYFLRTVEEGTADKSYGIHVADLAGIPGTVVSRAREVLAELERRSFRKLEQRSRHNQPTLFERDEALDAVKERLVATDLNTLTPIEALKLLDELKKLI